MKRIIYISLFTIIVIGLITLTGFIVIHNKSNQVSDIEVKIYRNSESGFLNHDEILTTIQNMDDLSLHQTVDSGQIINNPETDKIEKFLIKNPYVDKVDSYFTVDGKLLINIKEKKP